MPNDVMFVFVGIADLFFRESSRFRSCCFLRISFTRRGEDSISMRKSVDNAEKYSLGVGTITPLVLLHNQSVVLLILYLCLHHRYFF